MTSKEALKKIYHCYNVDNSDIDYNNGAINCDSYFEQIEKDLEVLEILKPIIKASIRISDYGISNSELALNIKVNKMLKEWLDDDKQRDMVKAGLANE